MKIRSDKKNLRKPYIAVNEKFNLTGFLKSEDFKFFKGHFVPQKNHITVLYVIGSSACMPCINEMFSFNEFFNKNNFEELPVQQCIIVIDSNRKRALRFVKSIDFSTPVILGYDHKYSSLLISFDDLVDNHQLLIIHNNTKTIFFRLHLNKGRLSPYWYKQKILNEAKSYFHTMDKTNSRN